MTEPQQPAGERRIRFVRYPAALISAAGLAVLVVAGCGGPGEGSPIRKADAQAAVASVFERPMVDNVITGPDATTDHIAGSFTGGNDQEHLVGVVFSKPNEVRALTGSTNASSLSGPGRTIFIRVANVMLLYTRRAGTLDRGPSLRRVLRAIVAKSSKA